jgi:hypothetical protein
VESILVNGAVVVAVEAIGDDLNGGHRGCHRGRRGKKSEMKFSVSSV